MNADHPYWQKIAAYLAGHLAEDEKAELDRWRKSSAENEQVFREASRIWQSSGVKLSYPGDDADLQWHALQQQLDKQNKPSIFPYSLSGTWLKIAAGFILIAGLTYVFFRPQPDIKDIAQVAGTTIVASQEVLTFYLPDSSRVWLNANSKLVYPDTYSTEKRQVQLIGEGYFEVKADSLHPFIVDAASTSVYVTGTSFNLKVDSTRAVTLTVAEGTVKFISDEFQQGTTVTTGEKAQLVGASIRQEKNQDPNFASWRRERNPQFDNEKNNPRNFLSTTFTWKKNQINRSVVEGVLKNSATLADYKNVVLKITYHKPTGRSSTVRLKVTETVRAGQAIPFQKKLFDILTDTRYINIEIEKAEIVTPDALK